MRTESPTVEAPPRISVITVCFNAQTTLPATLESIRAQGSGPWEWVVVDSASSDGTISWLQAQSPDIFLSEPDTGIYDAMNKALKLARGEWVFFLNAGDVFADKYTLQAILKEFDARAGVDIVYGDVIYFGRLGEKQRRFHWLKRHNLLFGDLCHQAAFVRRSLFLQIGDFDCTLRFNADFDWFLRAFRQGAGLRYTPRNIARFHDAGAHVMAGEDHLMERNRVRARYLPLSLWRIGNWMLRLELKCRRLFGQNI